MKMLKRFFVPLVLVFLVVVAYGSTLNYGFVSDDIPGIVRDGPTWTWKGVFFNIQFLTHWTAIFQFLIYQLVGPTPWAYRLVNICCHAISVLLVYIIVSRLSRRRIAFFAAAFFSVHPLIIESVTWISGGIYAQYSMMFLLSFWLYIRNREQRAEDRALSYFVYALSLLFSEKASVLFFMFILYEICFGNLKKNWRKLIPYCLLGIIFILFYYAKLGGRVADVLVDSGGQVQGLYNPLIQIPIAVTSYFELIVWPKNLTFYHSEMPFATADYVIRLLVFLGYCTGIIITALKNRKICFWLVWFLIPLLPTLTPLRIAWFVAERYTYLSVIGIFVLIAYGFELIIYWLCESPYTLQSQKKNHASSLRDCGRLRGSSVWLLIGLVYLALIFRTQVRNRDWQNEDTLWIATAKTAPAVPYSWNNLGDVFSRHGDYKKAAEMFQWAIVLNPNYAHAYHNLGETYRDMGEIGDAILMYEKAIDLNPLLWQTQRSLAGIYLNKKDYQKALFYIEEALKTVPDNQQLFQVREQLRNMQK